jgi:hypothetical protein
LTIVNGDACLEDLESKNGTFLRGRRIESKERLADGDRIHLGSVVLIFHARLDAQDNSTGAFHIGRGETVRARVTTDDPLCSPDWPHHCRRYRLIAPRDGLFEVVMTCAASARAYVLDIGVIDPTGQMWLPPPEQWRLGAQRSVKLPVTAGSAYVIEIWSSSAPGELFELTSSLEPAKSRSRAATQP